MLAGSLLMVWVVAGTAPAGPLQAAAERPAPAAPAAAGPLLERSRPLLQQGERIPVRESSLAPKEQAPRAHVALPRVRRAATVARSREVLPRREVLRRVVRESSQGYADRRGRAALRALHYPVGRLGYRIRFRPYTGSLLGTADARTRTITLFVRRGQSELSLRVSLAHEIGHAVDLRTMTSSTRAGYLSARGLRRDLPWLPCRGCNDYSSPAGDYAEVFALWLAGPGDFRSRLAGPPAGAALSALGTRYFQPPAGA